MSDAAKYAPRIFGGREAVICNFYFLDHELMLL